MGSNESPQQTSEENVVTVMVTGFEPFRALYPVNPSYLIAKSLPRSLPSRHGSPSATKIRILTYETPVRVSYRAVRKLVPELWTEHGEVDVMIHIGMSNSDSSYALEELGHRDGYGMADVDGEKLLLGDAENGLPGDAENSERWPKELTTSLNVKNVCERLALCVPDLTVKPSKNAGRYLCDFLYYSSLCELWKKSVKNKTAIFLHVPVHSERKDIENGLRVTLELIKAIADDWERAESA